SGLCSGEYVITRTWTATDECSNQTVHVQTITVEDNGNPIFNGTLPSDVTVECDTIPTVETLTANDTCGVAIVSYAESTASGLCAGEYVITRTWTATDECNNQAIHEQTITVEDNTDPAFTETLPLNAIYECDETIPSAIMLTAFDTCGTAIVTFNESTTNGSCSGDYFIIRTWTATDECNNVSTHIQTLTVVDPTNSTWDVLPTDMTVGCSANNQTEFETWLNSFSGTDNCGTATVSHDAPATVSCPGTVSVAFELADECGNSTIITATFTVEDTLDIPESEETGIIMFPNPTDKHIYFKGLREESFMEVFNIVGQKVFERSITNGKQIEFELKSGLYMVKLTSESKTVIKKLVIK
ncbi:MAG: T9SS type A sorting domain-containing protein, partial [Psychroserpens sp.]|uniref:T9SS type A sorting domain-containing protein n=1 Tax=Psychroserpens sp. TaxID=2020870 RepID=UPI003001EF6A